MTLQSACEYILPKTYEDVWYRGEVYVERNLITLAKQDKREARAVVRGTQEYITSLRFSGTTLLKKCTCPYAQQGSTRSPACKHMVALAIVWDEARHLDRPTREQIETDTIPPPLVSRFDIERALQHPTKANLEILRLASSSHEWHKPHARLPLVPLFSRETNEALSRGEIRKITREFLRWTKLPSYDPYHCAGEMIAGLCEVLRVAVSRVKATDAILAADILLDLQQLHRTMIKNLVDDSDGFHQFSEAHLDALRDTIKRERIRVAKSDLQFFEQKIWNYDVAREEY